MAPGSIQSPLKSVGAVPLTSVDSGGWLRKSSEPSLYKHPAFSMMGACIASGLLRPLVLAHQIPLLPYSPPLERRQREMDASLDSLQELPIGH